MLEKNLDCSTCSVFAVSNSIPKIKNITLLKYIQSLYINIIKDTLQGSLIMA